jgi:hypothetical protein
MQGIPEQIESGNLVGKKLDGKKYAGGGNHPPTGDHVQACRQIKYAGVGEQSQGGDCRVYVESGGKAYRYDQPYEVRASESGAAQFHACQHLGRRPPRRCKLHCKTGQGRLRRPCSS